LWASRTDPSGRPPQVQHPSQQRPIAQGGYSVVELLVAMGITLSVLGSLFTLVNGWQLRFGAESEGADVRQRLRVAADTLSKDLRLAGAGVRYGGGAGPLGVSVASVLPFRQGALAPDAPGTFRTDAVTALYVLAETTAQTTIRQPVAATSGTAIINLDAGCPQTGSACGFAPGMDVIVYDETGSYDTFRVTEVQPATLQLQHTMTDTPQFHAAGATIAEAASTTYTLKTNPDTDTFQLIRYNGVGSAAAAVDHVVGLAFEYFGEPLPPVLLRAVTDPVGPWTTYGPRPPPPGVQSTAYDPGENCAFEVDAATGHQVSRLPLLGSGSRAFVKLTAAELTDGPWCPDPTNPHRYDADLLRIRRVSVTVRVEASLSALRGPASILFARGGTARLANAWVPDEEIRFDISPRNLNAPR
jgi:hypothetical protein